MDWGGWRWEAGGGVGEAGRALRGVKVGCVVVSSIVLVLMVVARVVGVVFVLVLFLRV